MKLRLLGATGIATAVCLSCAGSAERGVGRRAPSADRSAGAEPASSAGKPESAPAILRELFRDDTLYAIADDLPRDHAFSVTVRLGADGKLLSAEIRSEIGKSERAKVERTLREQIFPGMPKGTYKLEFTAGEVGQAQSMPQASEMTPEPPSEK